MRADDALKYAAAMLDHDTEWARDSIVCEHDHDDALNAISEAIAKVKELAARTGDPDHYADGRVVRSSCRIVQGLMTSRVWHPDPNEDSCTSFSDSLPCDPGVPSPGVYEVSMHPATQRIDVRVVGP